MVVLKNYGWGRRLRLALLVAAICSQQAAGQCIPARYRNGTGPSRAGCPQPPHGNYYGVGRTILQTFIPVMSMFINTNYSVTPLTDENIAVREYMRARLLPYLPPFRDFQCRCNSSLQEPARLLRDGFINDGYQSMVNYTRNSTSIERIEKLQTFIRSNLQAMKDLRCTQTLSDARFGITYNQLPPAQNCTWSYRRVGKIITLNNVRCPPRVCPNGANLY